MAEIVKMVLGAIPWCIDKIFKLCGIHEPIKRWLIVMTLLVVVQLPSTIVFYLGVYSRFEFHQKNPNASNNDRSLAPAPAVVPTVTPVPHKRRHG